MKNPLTQEERLFITKLIEHDLVALQRDVIRHSKGGKTNSIKNITSYHHEHVLDVMLSIPILSDTECFFKEVTQQDLETKVEQILAVLDELQIISYSLDINRNFMSQLPLLYTALFNLAKNSTGVVNPKRGRIKLSISDFSGTAPNPVYASDETPLKGEFVRFAVNDNGYGFPRGASLKDFLKLEFGESYHFGLTYVYLVCRYLRSNLTIESQQGNTTVSIYHPLNLK